MVFGYHTRRVCLFARVRVMRLLSKSGRKANMNKPKELIGQQRPIEILKDR
jgi:hypothetical protein